VNLFVSMINDELEPEICGSEPVSLKSKLSLNLWVWNMNLANAEYDKWWTYESEISECEHVIQYENWDW
jgi:hypothetical protein